MTPNNFSDYYKTISNTELLDILERQEKYQTLAVEAAKKEFDNRQLTEEEVRQAREPLITKQLEKEQQRQRVKAVENKVRDAGGILVDTLLPIQSGTPTTNKLIRIISVVFFGIFLFQIISDFRMFSGMIKDIAKFDSSSFFYFLPFVIIPVASVTFWMKKTIGWMLLTFFIIYSEIGVIWSLFQSYNYQPTGTSLDNLFPRPSPIVYVIQMLFLTGTLYIISKVNVREVFKINRQRLVATFFMSVLVSIFFILEL